MTIEGTENPLHEATLMKMNGHETKMKTYQCMKLDKG